MPALVKLQKDLREFIALLLSQNVEFLVVGGHAVAFHGYPRLTEDVDLLIRPTLENGSRILRALDLFGFGDIGLTAEDFTAPDRMIQLGRAPNRIDLLTQIWGELAGFDPVERLDLRPLPMDQSLPEIDLMKVPDEQRQLADQG